jgi:hypothetical protein
MKRQGMQVARLMGWLLVWPLLMVMAGAEAADTAPAARTGRLQLQQGSVDGATPLSLKATGSLWQSPQGVLQVAEENLLSWRACPAGPVGSVLQLQRGERIAGRLLAWNEAEVVLASPLFGRVTLPASVVLGWQATAGWRTTAAGDGPLEIVLTNGDTLVASTLTLSDTSATAEITLALSSAEAALEPAITVAVDRHRLARIWRPPLPASQPQPNAAEPGAVVGFQDGTRLCVTQLEVDDQQCVTLWPVFSHGRPLPPLSCSQESLTGLVAVGPHCLPLAWHPPQQVLQTPQRGPAWPLTTTSTLTGGPLTARGLRAFTGLGLHAPARVTYRLPDLPERVQPEVSTTDDPACWRLLAMVAVDDTAGEGGSVVVRIRVGAEATARRLVYESPVLRGGEPPCEIDVTLQDGKSIARWLELDVDPAGDGEVLDRTVWLEPRLVRRRTSQSGLRVPLPAASGALLETFPARR